jgi:hypothetical protein
MSPKIRRGLLSVPLELHLENLGGAALHNKAMELTGRGRWRAAAGGRRPPQCGG